MNKYIRGIICLIYSNIKFLILKILYFKNFKYSIYTFFSPFTEIDIDRKSKLSIEKKVRVKSGSKLRVRKNACIEIGQNTSLNHSCIFTAHQKIKIGKNVQFGPNVLIYDHDHDFRVTDGLKNLKYKTDCVTIGNNVWIGANVVILKGTIIGDNSVIGAGSIIKGKYPSNSLIIQKRVTSVEQITI